MTDHMRHQADASFRDQSGDIASVERFQLIAVLLETCNTAKEMADTIDEKFLSYLLSMVVLEVRSRLQRSVELDYPAEPSHRRA